MRRSSLTNQTSIEPTIVVEEPGVIFEEIERSDGASPQQSFDIDSPSMNPFLLSPWRDSREVRKHSLPTPQCSGITASQVRRLSDRGGEGPTPREAAFLATLSQAPGPSPAGRRHSVVTISKVPTTFFGRARRESIAAYPTGGTPNRILGSRRESLSGAVGPPSTDHHGSIHNLQLDIMDDIVTARKVRMKMWNTSSEKVCEVQPLDETTTASTQRYTQPAAVRRNSDFVGTQLTAIPSTRRRASEIPPTKLTEEPSKEQSNTGDGDTGIICSNTDLIFILSNLTSSATEINQSSLQSESKTQAPSDHKRSKMKSKRSRSFDVSILHGTKLTGSHTTSPISLPSPSNWFQKRHEPMSKKDGKDKIKTGLFSKDKSPKSKSSKDTKSSNKVVWDGRSGSLVDATALGSAIEVFLRKGGTPEKKGSISSSGSSPSKGAIPKKPQGKSKSRGWYSKDSEEEKESCDSSSICATLKDLFVK